MNIPGFTAEASLYNVSTRYRATAKANFYGGLVQTAGSGVLSDPGGSSMPFLSTQLFDRSRPVWCIRNECAFWDANDPSRCWAWLRSVGVLNPVTGYCD